MDQAAQTDNLFSNNPICCTRHHPQYQYPLTRNIFQIGKVRITYGNGIPNYIHLKEVYGVSPPAARSVLSKTANQELLDDKNSPIASKMMKEASYVSQEQLCDQVLISDHPIAHKKSVSLLDESSQSLGSLHSRILDNSESMHNKDEVVSIDPSLNIEEGTGSFGYPFRVNSRNNEPSEGGYSHLTPLSEHKNNFFKKGKKIYQSEIHKKQSRQLLNSKKSTEMLLNTKKKTEESIEREEEIAQVNENSQIFISKQILKTEEREKELEELDSQIKDIELAESKYYYGHVRHSSHPQKTPKNSSFNSSLKMQANAIKVEDGEQIQPINNISSVMRILDPMPECNQSDNSEVLKMSELYSCSISNNPQSQIILQQNHSVQKQIEPSHQFISRIDKEQYVEEKQAKKVFNSVKKRKRISIFKDIAEVDHNLGIKSQKINVKKSQLKGLPWVDND